RPGACGRPGASAIPVGYGQGGVDTTTGSKRDPAVDAREEGRMASRFTELVIDAHDTRKLAEFWCRVLDYQILDGDQDVVEIGAAKLTTEEVLGGPVPSTIVFVPVPDDKAVKNRVHIDLSPIDRDPPEEVDRLLALGATRADIGQGDVPW